MKRIIKSILMISVLFATATMSAGCTNGIEFFGAGEMDAYSACLAVDDPSDQSTEEILSALDMGERLSYDAASENSKYTPLYNAIVELKRSIRDSDPRNMPLAISILESSCNEIYSNR